MRRTLRVTARLLTQFRHDPRLLVMVVVLPVVVMFLLDAIFGAPDYRPLILHSGVSAQLLEATRDTDARLRAVPSEEQALETLRSSQADAFLTEERDRVRVVLEGSDPAKAGAALQAIREASLERFGTAGVGTVTLPDGRVVDPEELGIRLPEPPGEPEVERVYGAEDMRTVDYFGPVLIGYLAFFFVLMISGISFLRERTGGTMDRLMASPLRRHEIVLGYVLGFGVLALVQSAMVAAAAVYLVGLTMLGAFVNVLLGTVSLGFVALALGLLISEFANTELQVIQMLQLVLVPQIFLSGIFDLSTAPQVLRSISELMPLTYGARVLRDVMLRGHGLAEIGPDLAVLAAFAAVFLVADVLVLRKYRRV